MGHRFVVQLAVALLVGACTGVVLHGVSVGAGTDPSDGPAAEVAAARLERDPGVDERVAAAAAGAVVEVEAGGCGKVRQASATAVRRGDGVELLTNAHVVVGAGTATLRLPDGSTAAATVRGAVPGRDAAVLELADPGDLDLLDPLALGPEPVEGQAVTVAGHPDGAAALGSGRVVSVERRAAYGGSSDVLVVDVPVRGGSSGGAVLDAEGRVVGLVAARDARRGDAVAYPIDEVLGRGLAPIPGC